MMQLKTAADELRGNAYPGRGILLGRTPDGTHAAIAYFIMGRSENSRNRVFAADGDGLRTRAFDPSKVKDPSLILYSPVRVFGGATIVTNGDQTDTVFSFLEQGKSFEEALRTRTFEPDAPNFTPRISGIAFAAGGFRYALSILKSAQGDPRSVRRFFFDYETPISGQGHLIHTYRCDGNPIPSFEGEPRAVSVENDLDEFTDAIWNSLNTENRVSLFTRFVDLKSGTFESRIRNKNN